MKGQETPLENTSSHSQLQSIASLVSGKFGEGKHAEQRRMEKIDTLTQAYKEDSATRARYVEQFQEFQLYTAEEEVSK